MFQTVKSYHTFEVEVKESSEINNRKQWETVPETSGIQ